MGNMDLPVELQYLVCSYLDLEDLRNLRLTSKNLAFVAAESLFEQIQFHASERSIDGVINIAHHECLSKHVKTIIWDSRLYDIAAETLEEWEAWGLEKYDLHELATKRSETRANNSIIKAARWVLRDMYEEYKQHREEEEEVLHSTLQIQSLPAILAQFQNLNEVCVVSGRYEFASAWPIKSQSSHSPSEQESFPKRGCGAYLSAVLYGPPALHAFTTLMHCLYCNAHSVQKLRVGHLSWIAFRSQFWDATWSTVFERLTTLELAFTVITEGGGDEYDETDECREEMSNGLLKLLLGRMRSLRKLSIEFENYYEADGDSPALLQDIFPMGRPWPHLQELSLGFLDTSEEFLVCLFNEHSTTLKFLHLKDLQLDPSGSWIRIFTMVQANLNLQSATVTGGLWSKAATGSWHDAWYLEEALSSALEQYLVHGGVCPLNEENQAKQQ